MSEGILTPPALTVDCQNCVRMQLMYLFDDLTADADESPTYREKKQLQRKARKVRQVLRSKSKMAKVEAKVAEKAYAFHLANGNVGEFGDGSIIEWLQNGGLEEILTFILGLMKGIADILLLLPYVMLCFAMTL